MASTRTRSIGLLLILGACTGAPGKQEGSSAAAPVSDAGHAALDASGDDADAPDAQEAPEADAALDASTGEAGGDDAASDDAAAVLDPTAFFAAYPRVPEPAGNPTTREKTLLGKALFWDEQLSSDDSVACGTCHRPEAGGSDPRPALAGYHGHPGPDGVRDTEDDPHGSPGIRACNELADGGLAYVDDAVFGAAPQVGRRRSMSALDAAFFPALFWDGRAGPLFHDPLDEATILLDGGAALESQAAAPLMNPSEMACSGRSWSVMVQKLGRVKPLGLSPKLTPDLTEHLRMFAHYPSLFEAAFGSPEITPARIAMAIAAYERGLVSDQTPWDRWQAGDTSALSEAELRGLDAFVRRGNCQCCHPAPLFASGLIVNDGFSLSTWDRGRADVVQTDAVAAFRTPGLRNVGLREAAGLLHDGTGAGRDLPTLLQRYTESPLVGGVAGICVRGPLSFRDQDIDDLLDFLREGLTDPRARQALPPFDHPALAHP